MERGSSGRIWIFTLQLQGRISGESGGQQHTRKRKNIKNFHFTLFFERVLQQWKLCVVPASLYSDVAVLIDIWLSYFSFIFHDLTVWCRDESNDCAVCRNKLKTCLSRMCESPPWHSRLVCCDVRNWETGCFKDPFTLRDFCCLRHHACLPVYPLILHGCSSSHYMRSI